MQNHLDEFYAMVSFCNPVGWGQGAGGLPLYPPLTSMTPAGFESRVVQ